MKLPIGVINFKELIEQNDYYVDKTMYLEKLENTGMTLFYLRPGKFGKSLFTSMMFYYYDVKSKKLFNHLFKDTYVYQNPTKERNNYYVIKFDFSGMSSAEKSNEELEMEFKEKVVDGIRNFCIHYEKDYQLDDSLTTNQILIRFLSYFNSLEYKQKLYILIDDYDNFINAILKGNAEQFKPMIGVVKDFYAIIKEYFGLGVIGRFFATGICPISLTTMTSGFNIAIDITDDIRFNNMLGFTHEEVNTLLSDIVLEKDREEIHKLIIENYGGYLFHKKASERVCNPTFVMYLLDYYQRFQTIPESLMDKNVVLNDVKMVNLLKLHDGLYYEKLVESLLKEDKIIGQLNNNFDLLVPFFEDDIISLLYYFGYLTIKKESFGIIIYFQIPNKVISNLIQNELTITF